MATSVIFFSFSETENAMKKLSKRNITFGNQVKIFVGQSLKKLGNLPLLLW